MTGKRKARLGRNRPDPFTDRYKRALSEQAWAQRGQPRQAARCAGHRLPAGHGPGQVRPRRVTCA